MDIAPATGDAEFQTRFSMKYKSLTRVLALDLHPRRFGYVVVGDSDKLLHWGVCSDRRKGNAADGLIRRRLKPLLELWRPSVVVLRDPPRIRTLNPQKNRLLKQIMKAAKDQRARVQILKKRPTDRAERLTNYRRAQAVVERFPVLTQKLPPKRKPWESEHYRMSMFSAAALAMTYFSLRYGTVTSPPGGVMPKFTQRRRS
jgi:hypothetical protein